MLYRPQPRTYGQTKAFIEGIYEALLQIGIPHPSLQSLSLRKAMLLLFGSDLAIDGSFGFGTYSGIKRPVSKVAQWRKVWSRVKKKQKALYLAQMAVQEAALAALEDAFDECLAAGVSTEAMHEVFAKIISKRFGGYLSDAA